MKSNNRNIVLIGMPGCGKTAIGRLTAERLNLEFCDIDDYIEEKYKTKISQIFEKGEEHFRDLESEAIEEVSKTHPKVIATGGGAVKRDKNLKVLGEKGIIIFINRSLENIISDIDIKDRPLLADGIQRIYKLFEERYDLYKSCCHYEVANDTTMEAAVDNIIRIYKKEGVLNEAADN